MTDYRVYCYDGAGKLREADWIQANSDEDAIVAVRALKIAAKYEVWHRERLVGTIEDGRATLGGNVSSPK